MNANKSKQMFGVVSVLLLGGSLMLVAQTTVHRFGAVRVLPDRSVSLELLGKPSSTYKQYFDIYPIERSDDLSDWQPLASLLRTNSSTNGLFYTDTNSTIDRPFTRFYRTWTRFFYTPFPSQREEPLRNPT